MNFPALLIHLRCRIVHPVPMRTNPPDRDATHQSCKPPPPNIERQRSKEHDSPGNDNSRSPFHSVRLAEHDEGPRVLIAGLHRSQSTRTNYGETHQPEGLNTPPSGRQRCYSSLPSKQNILVGIGEEGFRVPPIPDPPGRTQPTPSASRSDGAELTGVAISILGI